MTGKRRTDQLTTTEMYNLDNACRLISRAFGDECPYLVGTAGFGEGPYRDVDVRLMLDADDFAAVCPTLARWELLCIAIGAYLSERTGLPVDFQIQRADIANERFSGSRNPGGPQPARHGADVRWRRRRHAGLAHSAVTLLARLKLWLRRQKCRMYVGTCPLCACGTEESGG